MSRSIWFGRLVLVAASVLMGVVGTRYLVNPTAAVSEQGTVLTTADALTSARVSGGLFLALLLILLACMPVRRLLFGLSVLATVSTALLAVRLLGLLVDGPGPFTLKVLKPEVGLVLLSLAALFLERRRLATREWPASTPAATGALTSELRA